MRRIIVLGMGNIGRRHLESLSSSNSPFELHAYDPLNNEENLSFIAKRENQPNQIIYHSNLDQVNKYFDLAISSTTADNRFLSSEAICKKSKVANWLFEKPLSQSIKDLDGIKNITKISESSWVNINRRSMNWYKQIKKKLQGKGPFKITVGDNNWGLACNSSHFLNLSEWFTGEEIVEFDTSNLHHEWISSKRKGFFEVLGEIKVSLSQGSSLYLKNDGGKKFLISIDGSFGNCTIDEDAGLAYFPSQTLEGKYNLQSELTDYQISEIFENPIPNLASFEECYYQHKKLLLSLLTHWNNCNNSKDTVLPIT